MDGKLVSESWGTVLSALAVLLTVQGCGADSRVVSSRIKRIIHADGASFRDLNANARVDAYEDWRLSANERAEDLLSRMTLEEKAGMILIHTLNSESNGALPERAGLLVESEHMTRFILRNPVVLSFSFTFGREQCFPSTPRL